MLNVLLTRKFCSPKLQFAKCQCLCIINVLSCLFIHYILCLRCLPQQRTLRIPANYANSAQFRPHGPQITRNSHHLLTYYIVCFRCRPVAENSLKFQQIERNSLNSPTYPTNYANSAHFALNSAYLAH